MLFCGILEQFTAVSPNHLTVSCETSGQVSWKKESKFLTLPTSPKVELTQTDSMFYCFMTSYHQQRDSTHTLLISVSITQKSRHSLAAIQALTSAAVSSEGKDLLQAHSVCWQSLSLWSSKAEIIISSLATHQVPLSASRAHSVFPPCCPFLKPSHYMVDYFWKANKSLFLSVFNQLREFHIVRYNHRSYIQTSFRMAQW